VKVLLLDDEDYAELRRGVPAEIEFVDSIEDADAVVCGRLGSEDVRGATRLRLVQSLSAGADGIDRAALPPDCVLCNVYEHELAIGEWCLGAMLALAHRLREFDADLRRGEWHRDERGGDYPVPDLLHGRTVGTIGHGHIARRVLELARSFGMETRSVRRTAGDLDELMRTSDWVVVACPLTDETRGLVGARELDLLGPDGYLVNPARGPVVDERALYEALRDGRIAGAAIDTWYRYPDPVSQTVLPSELPFHELANVLLSPHVSGRSELTTRRRWAFVAAQLQRLERGEPLENVVAR
jgi:phosphoglycerate dehydrogenase-like enzyme